MKNKYYLLLIIWILVFIWSAINPKDYFTWMLEVTPGVIGMIIILLTYKKFQFSYFIYVLILLHCIVLFVGGKYTYAENPFFEYIKNMFDLGRNNYDKLGHFMQGFVPSLILREIIIKLKIINQKKWIPYFMISTAMFISAIYELIEWMVSEITGESADAFLGTQGYVWDTQSDMLYALIGSLVAIVVFSRIHDRVMVGKELRNFT